MSLLREGIHDGGQRGKNAEYKKAPGSHQSSGWVRFEGRMLAPVEKNQNTVLN